MTEEELRRLVQETRALGAELIAAGPDAIFEEIMREARVRAAARKVARKAQR
jgi:hypothetical protein